MKTIVGYLILGLIGVICLSVGNVSAQHGDYNFHEIQGVEKLNYDSLFADAIPLEKSEAGQALLAGCVKKYGGEEKLNSLKSFRLKYEMSAVMGGSHPVQLVKSYQVGRKYKIFRSGMTGVERRIINGGEAWFIGRDTMITLYSGRYKAELFSYLTLGMPLAAKTERFDDIRYGQRDADSLRYIYMTKTDSLMIIIGIDPDDHLIKSSEGLIKQENGNFVFINRFSNFTEYDGFLFPNELVNISMGLEVGKSKLLKVEINLDFDESEFRPEKTADNKKSY